MFPLDLRRKPIVAFAVSVGLLFLAIVDSTALSSNGEASASYVSVRALDHYGNAVQLSHAKEAALRYGRPVVVAVVEGQPKNNNSTETKAGDTEESKTTTSSSFLMVVSLGITPILHPVQLPLQEEDDGERPMLAMCFTGVKGDANWLLRQIQKHAASVWERYGVSTMSSPAIAHVVARLLGRFAAQPEQREWQSSLGLPGKQDGDDDRQSSWSRPLGVQTMILSLGALDSTQSQQRDHRHPELLIVEPSGRILNPSVRSKSGKVSLGAMGKGSDKMQEELLRLFRGDLDDIKGGDDVSSSLGNINDGSSSWEDLPPTYDRCQDVLIRILLEESANTSNGNNISSYTEGDIMVESYSPKQGKIERRLFRYNQKAKGFATI